MKSYLSLIPLSAKVHKRQNRMTILCIIFSVFMVTSIFSLSEIFARMEQQRLLEKHDSISYKELLSSSSVQTLLLVATILFILVLLAGVLMISGTINSTISQKTSFFGMMRCIGMSKKQIKHFVTLESLNWCKTSIPLGVGFGIVFTWIMCAILRFVVAEEFTTMPIFSVSIIGIISGILVGVITVLIASKSPAKKAAKISPVMAVSNNTSNNTISFHKTKNKHLKIETALGINHATTLKKNLILMTSSFALSIILFLTFTVLIDLVNCMMPQSASTADIEMYSKDEKNSIDCNLIQTLSHMNGVANVYGRSSSLNIPATVIDKTNTHSSADIDVISYDDFEIECLKKDHSLKRKSDIKKVIKEKNYVLATSDPYSTLKINDKIVIKNEEYIIAGLLKNDPFSSNGLTNGKITLITSKTTFNKITNDKNYSLLMIQTSNTATDNDVDNIQKLVKDKCKFEDLRDLKNSGTYMAFVFCIYGFLGIIMLVSLLNIINSISMSVSSRIKQYGAMKAVGMDNNQMSKMIASEAITYSLCGFIVGVIIGLFANKLIYDKLITSHYPYAIWSLPINSLLIIIIFLIISTILAIYQPIKRIKKISVTEMINEL